MQIFAVSLMTRQQACVNVGCSLGRFIHSAETTTALETRYACFEALETRYVCFAAENTLNERMIKRGLKYQGDDTQEYSMALDALSTVILKGLLFIESHALTGERISQRAIAQLIGDPRYKRSERPFSRKSNHLLMSM